MSMALLFAAAAVSSLRNPNPGSADDCRENACCGMAHYPVGNETAGFNEFYAEFDVPGMPESIDGITDYIYFNIFFASGIPNGRMNQFVPQLMLGAALDSTSGPPYYIAQWHTHKTWVFSAQYFMEIFNTTTNNTEGKANTGEIYNCTKGEILYTKFTLDKDYVWTIVMGVKGDASRTSTLKVDKPYMGLLDSNPGAGAKAPKWSDAAFSKVSVNSCWELYGNKDRAHYPSSGSKYDMVVRSAKPNGIEWMTNWVENEKPTCPGAPSSSIAETHDTMTQSVQWNLTYPN